MLVCLTIGAFFFFTAKKYVPGEFQIYKSPDPERTCTYWNAFFFANERGMKPGFHEAWTHEISCTERIKNWKNILKNVIFQKVEKKKYIFQFFQRFQMQKSEPQAHPQIKFEV